MGHRDPKQANKESLRSFYGIDRVDNAFFISENFSESLIERDYLFKLVTKQPSSAVIQDRSQERKLVIKSLVAQQNKAMQSSSSFILSGSH